MAKKKPILYPVFFMILVTVVFTTGLALVNELTIDRIEEQEAQKLQKSILRSIGIDVEDTAIGATFDEVIQPIETEGSPLFLAIIDGLPAAYVTRFEGPGLWGTVTGYLAVSLDGSTLLGVDILSHNETPGLGGRITETWFQEQFQGIPLENLSGGPLTYTPAPGGNVDAISGATGTSASVLKIFNETIRRIVGLIGEGL